MADPAYICPICLAIRGLENEHTWIMQDDIFYEDELILAFISSKSITGNEGHPLIVPKEHYKNLYSIPAYLGTALFSFSRELAQALKTVRRCGGITILQNNEPAGDQHAFHYHMHVIPRFENDNMHTELWKAQKSKPQERKQYSAPLKEYFTYTGRQYN